jgi:acyl-CoA synthetase (AMP-forming)/AMP-acid ligase II
MRVDAPDARDGEIVVRGPNVMQGYHRNPDATAEALRDGWLHTGDVGYVDADGFFFLVDRRKDMINPRRRERSPARGRRAPAWPGRRRHAPAAYAGPVV